tara:strand:+ start:187 stop:351 length:165 start_codon:yes stop_codon:yes gene_type:complete
MHISKKVLKQVISTPGKNWSFGSNLLNNSVPVNPVWHVKGLVKNKWYHVLSKRF